MNKEMLNQYKKLGLMSPRCVKNILNKLDVEIKVLNTCLSLKEDIISKYITGELCDLEEASAVSKILYVILYDVDGFISEVKRNRHILSNDEYDRIVKNVDYYFRDEVTYGKFNVKGYYNIKQFYITLQSLEVDAPCISLVFGLENKTWHYTTKYKVGNFNNDNVSDNVKLEYYNITMNQIYELLKPDVRKFDKFEVYDKHCKNVMFIRDRLHEIVNSESILMYTYEIGVDLDLLENILPGFRYKDGNKNYWNSYYNYKVIIGEDSNYLVCTNTFAKFINSSSIGWILNKLEC